MTQEPDCHPVKSLEIFETTRPTGRTDGWLDLFKETTVKETTVKETTVKETTVKETTVKETTVPHQGTGVPPRLEPDRGRRSRPAPHR